MSRSNGSGDELSARRIYERELLYGEAIESILALMQERGISQRELADRLNVSEARVSRMLRGGENLTLKTVADLGWALGIRFVLTPVPYDSHEDTPAEGDAAAPSWIREFRKRIPAKAAGPG